MGNGMAQGKPDFLRQLFNVVLAKHQEKIDPRSLTELRKMVWEAENEYKFCAFENPDPTTNLRKFLESVEFGEILRLLKSHEEILKELQKEIEEYYGKELVNVIVSKLEEINEIEAE
jgi:hypothetical protein